VWSLFVRTNGNLFDVGVPSCFVFVNISIAFRLSVVSFGRYGDKERLGITEKTFWDRINF